jgi:CRP-like cAMP-binding protein
MGKGKGANVRKYASGKILIQENDTGQKMFVIQTGKVKVYKTYFGKKVTLAILGPGEMFGELSFFDASPRSASVEAVSEVSAIVIDGEEALQKVQNLPSWVISIFKTVFYRFREADQQLMVLQNMNNFQKKTHSTDIVGQSIYKEIVRFNKLLEIIFEKNDLKETGTIIYGGLYKEMDHTLGQKDISLRVYFNAMAEADILKGNLDNLKSGVSMDKELMDKFNAYLLSEIETTRCLLIGHESIQLLTAILGYLPASFTEKVDENEVISLNNRKFPLKRVPYYSKGVKELVRFKIIVEGKEDIRFNFSKLYYTYIFQSVLSHFDPSVVQL